MYLYLYHKLTGRSLRYKLLTLVWLPVLLIMLMVTVLAYVWVNQVSYQQLFMKVNADLNIAKVAFLERQNKYLADLAAFAGSYQFLEILEIPGKEKQAQVILPLLEDLRLIKGFDFVLLVGADGCDYFSSSVCTVESSPLFTAAIAGEAAAGIEIFSSEQLAAISPELAKLAYLPLVDTPHARPTDQNAAQNGMVLHSVYPVKDHYSDEVMILIGGVLLNRNFEFVDTLRDLVYSQGTLSEGGLGTVTIFLDDVRITTNVPNVHNETEIPKQRALGTRVSEEVRERVLSLGEVWVDRAFVVSEWYISAYKPIIDVYGKRVGMLYTGFLEAPFRETYFKGFTLLIVSFMVVILLSTYLAVRGAKSIYKPIEAMANVIKRIQQGEDLRIGKLESRDELSVLAHQLDDMLDKLQSQRDQIQKSADELELKVEERTQLLKFRTVDLERNISLLKQTREKLVANEKLAAIGELSAGIAHEINNPTAVILGNMDLLIQELGEQSTHVSRETGQIIDQVYRIRAIINNLLEYSRPEEYQTPMTLVDVNQVIQDALVLVKHDLGRRNISVNLDLRDTMQVKGNHQQFQQVLINLVVNAMNAIDHDGKIIIRTRNWRRQGVLLTIRDTGRGIQTEIMPRIFDPFFTRTSSGTGLGLYISYGILKRYAAEIAVRSREGAGCCFFIWFYSDPSTTSPE